MALFLRALIIGVLAVLLPACGDTQSRQATDDLDVPRLYSPAATSVKAAFHPERILLRFEPGVSGRAREKAFATAQVREERAYRHIPGLHLARLKDGQTLSSAIQALERSPHILYAERDAMVQLDQTLPNDPDYDQLWGLPHIGAPDAWSLTTGSPEVVVAVIDTGVDYTHPDLVDNMWVNPGESENDEDSDGNGYVDDLHGLNAITDSGDPMDDHGHGTHVAGTIAARGNNDIGITGVAWEARVIACKFIGEQSDGEVYGFTADAIQCLDYLLDIKNRHDVDIVLTNNSWGGGDSDQSLRDAIQAHQEAGILFVTSAGNDGKDNDSNDYYPANYDVANILSVAATDQNDELAGFSNYGKNTVHLGAPGVGIYSTLPGNDYATWSGTSMAAPHVSGVLGLLKAQDPRRDGAALKQFLLDGVKPIDALSDKVITGGGLLAWGANDQGALNCGRYAREWSTASGAILPLESSRTLEAIFIAGCYGDADAFLPVTVMPDEITLELTPEGDGLYALAWSPATSGPRTFRLDTGEEISVEWKSELTPYEEVLEVAFGLREMTPEGSTQGEQQADTPFPIVFGDHPSGFQQVYLSARGILSFSQSTTEVTDAAMPTEQIETLVAPLWLPSDDIASEVSWAVAGVSPEREWVIQWDVHQDADCGTRKATVQVVFFEGLPSLLMNYRAGLADEDCVFAFSEHGGGVQTSVFEAMSFTGLPDAAQFSYLWTLGDATASPVAVAWTVGDPVSPGESVTLVGSDSYVAEGSIVAHEWRQVSGLPVTWQTDVYQADPDILAPASGRAVLELVVYDQGGATDSTRTAVQVSENLPPVADAGPDQVELASSGIVHVDGSASHDPDGTIVHYEWQQISGAEVEWLEPKSQAVSRVRLPDSGRVVFRLRVVDDSGSSGEESVAYQLVENLAPVISIKGPQEAFPGAFVILDARESHDPDGAIRSFEWQQVSGPPVEWDGRTTPRAEFHAPDATGEEIVVSLEVVDDSGAKTTQRHHILIVAEESDDGETDAAVAGSVEAFDGDFEGGGCDSAGGSSSLPFILLGILLGWLRLRRHILPHSEKTG